MCADCPVYLLNRSPKRTRVLGAIVAELCVLEDLEGELPNAARNPEDFYVSATEKAAELGASRGRLFGKPDEAGAVVSCASQGSCDGIVNNERIEEIIRS